MATISEHHKKELQAFFDTIVPWRAAYADARFTFIGTKKDGVIKVLQGQLLLGYAAQYSAQKYIETASVAAGQYFLANAEQDFDVVLEQLLAGNFDTPFGPAELCCDQRNEIGISLNRYPQVIGGTQKRITKLLLSGSQWRQQFLDTTIAMMELRATGSPYADINELTQELIGTSYSDGSSASIEVLALNVAEVDLGKRIVDGRAEFGIFVSRHLEPGQCSLGYRVLVKGEVVERSRLDGTMFTWETKEPPGRLPLQQGCAGAPVPPGAIVQCFVSYAGHFQHDGWVGDPATFPNALRMAHNAFDPDLEVLKRYLSEPKTSKDRDARDFEIGIANLLFMLGFSVDPLFGKPLEDGPDLIATTREGHIALVECTTSAVIDNNGKLGKLVDRAEKLRADLKNAAHEHLRVLPIIVTPRPRTAVADVESAKRIGVVVVAKEALETAIGSTIVPQDPDALFLRAWESVQTSVPGWPS